jgi:uncharacterized OB-fold protein
MTATPAIDGWFTTDAEPRLLGSRCDSCSTVFFPPSAPEGFCRNPGCGGESFTEVGLSRRGRVWSYTDAQYEPPPPYIPSDPFEPFALAAVELDEGMVVLGQVAAGYGVQHLRVGAEVELVVETLYADDTGDRLVWRWKPVTELGEEGEQ